MAEPSMEKLLAACIDGYRIGIEAAAKLVDADPLMAPGPETELINKVRTNLAMHVRGLADDLGEITSARRGDA